MVNYKCDRCNYTTTYKGHFRDHLNRKTPCYVIYEDIPICEICKKYDIVLEKSPKQSLEQSPKQSHKQSPKQSSKQSPNKTKLFINLTNNNDKYIKEKFVKEQDRLSNYINDNQKRIKDYISNIININSNFGGTEKDDKLNELNDENIKFEEELSIKYKPDYTYLTENDAKPIIKTEEGYKCYICSQYFTLKSNLKRHIINIHNMSEDDYTKLDLYRTFIYENNKIIEDINKHHDENIKKLLNNT